MLQRSFASDARQDRKCFDKKRRVVEAGAVFESLSG